MFFTVKNNRCNLIFLIYTQNTSSDCLQQSEFFLIFLGDSLCLILKIAEFYSDPDRLVLGPGLAKLHRSYKLKWKLQLSYD